MLSSLCHMGHAGRAAEALLPACQRHAANAPLWRLLALAARDAGDPEQAVAAASHAAALLPDHASTALLNAQIHYEAGLPSVDLFREALKLDPANADALRNYAMALVGEGAAAQGEAMLAQAVAQRPEWLDGQRQLATLRQLRGDPQCDRAYADARQELPRHAPLAMAHFQLLAMHRRWDDAAAVLADAVATMGETLSFRLASLFLASESGRAANDVGLFDAVAHINDPGLALARVRHALRGGRADQVEPIIAPLLGGAAANALWPYQSLAWRLTGDRRAEWLDRPDRSIKSLSLDWSADDMAALAAYLRDLHIASAPYPDQSVRGGTQTDRPLLFRAHPLIASLRTTLCAAVRDYVAALPPAEAGHPMLGVPRGEVSFAGSWSVRLSAQGFHACHTHPQGWISSALYVALPSPTDLGSPPAGWLQFGSPPPELGLTLDPYAAVEPVVGKLILFPSTMWHGTVPFDDGERLTVAFDVRVPRW